MWSRTWAVFGGSLGDNVKGKPSLESKSKSTSNLKPTTSVSLKERKSENASSSASASARVSTKPKVKVKSASELENQKPKTKENSSSASASACNENSKPKPKTIDLSLFSTLKRKTKDKAKRVTKKSQDQNRKGDLSLAPTSASSSSSSSPSTEGGEKENMPPATVRNRALASSSTSSTQPRLPPLIESPRAEAESETWTVNAAPLDSAVKPEVAQEPQEGPTQQVKDPTQHQEQVGEQKNEVKNVEKKKKVKVNLDQAEDDEPADMITFIYSEDDERFIVKPAKNPMAVLLGIDSLTKFTKTFSNPDNLFEGELPWTNFTFVLDPLANRGKDQHKNGDYCESPNLKSPDFLKFLNKFGPLLTRVRFNFNYRRPHDHYYLDEDEDEVAAIAAAVLAACLERSGKTLEKKTNGIELQDFCNILSQKLPNLEVLYLDKLPNDPLWKSLGKGQSDSQGQVQGQSSSPQLQIQLPELDTLILEKYEDYSDHTEFMGLLLSAAPNLTAVRNFQLPLLDTFHKQGKLDTIKDIEVVHPSSFSQQLWVVDDYLEMLRKFADLTGPGSVSGEQEQKGEGQEEGQGQLQDENKGQQKIRLEKLLIIPDEGFSNKDDSINCIFSEIYSQILENSKDSLKTWSIYPLSESAIPAPSSLTSLAFSQLSTLKLYEMDVCQKGIFKIGTIFKDVNIEVKNNDDGATENGAITLDLGAKMFPRLTKVELAASKFFHKYSHHPLQSESSAAMPLTFPTVTSLDLTLGSARSEFGTPFLYNLFDLFKELSATFPNVVHLKIRCYQKLRYVLRALSATPGFKTVKSLHLEVIEVEDFISQYRRVDPDDERDRDRNRNRARKNKGNKSGQSRHRKCDREQLLLDAFLDVIMGKDEESEVMAIDLDKIRKAPQFQHVTWRLSGVVGLDYLVVGLASHDLDHAPYFEGFRMAGPVNFNILQVARPRKRVEIVNLEDLESSDEYQDDSPDKDKGKDKSKLKSALPQDLDTYFSDSDSDFDYNYYNYCDPYGYDIDYSGYDFPPF